MEKKLRRRFILMSMAALFVVLFLLFGGINTATYVVITNTQDSTLRSIAANGSRIPSVFPEPPFVKRPPQEARSTTRFFSVTLNAEGKVVSTSLDFVSSVTADDARAYAEAVQSKNRANGYYGDYRYYIYKDGVSTVLVFLYSGSQLLFMKILLVMSVCMAFVCFVLMFLLAFFFSKRAVAPLVKNMEIQKRFITDAGHELKTPLTSISTSVDLLAYDHGDNEWIKNIQKQILRLTKLVNNLVTMSRLDEEMPIPDKAYFSLSDALWESLEPFQAVAEAKGKTFEKNIEDGMVMYGDIVSVQQMVSVLLDNAIKYSDDGGSIRIDAYRKRSKNVIEVFNTCPELDTKNLDRLFDRFYRADQSRSNTTSGTGVGLSIAKAIAKVHNGSVSVKSTDGRSIVFTVTL